MDDPLKMEGSYVMSSRISVLEGELADWPLQSLVPWWSGQEHRYRAL